MRLECHLDQLPPAARWRDRKLLQISALERAHSSFSTSGGERGAMLACYKVVLIKMHYMIPMIPSCQLPLWRNRKKFEMSPTEKSQFFASPLVRAAVPLAPTDWNGSAWAPLSHAAARVCCCHRLRPAAPVMCLSDRSRPCVELSSASQAVYRQLR